MASTSPVMVSNSTQHVSLCTPSPPSIGQKSPIPIVCNHQNDNVSELNMDVSYSSISSPVLLDGLDLYDYMLIDAIQNFQISSSPADEQSVDPSIDILGTSNSDLIVDKADFI
ncbi:hypothetical protein ZOSMA_28G00460 [Zostera marina]|uniref:Uncharacterized protein n=1 Tax=Zostera marina TaxID=29655 RepID=A0A0K9PCA7_ZOSMR|nr:hypothetical protein ZOSMA_28G00460 [Zostera marina]